MTDNGILDVSVLVAAQVEHDLRTVSNVLGFDLRPMYECLAEMLSRAGATHFAPALDLYSDPESYLLICSFRIDGKLAYSKVRIRRSTGLFYGMESAIEEVVEDVRRLRQSVSGVANGTH